MKKIICFLIFILGLLSCETITEKKVDKKILSNTDTLSTQTKQTKQQPFQIDLSNIQCIPTPYRYGYGWSYFSPGTLGEITYLYSSTSQNPELIDTLKFNTRVNILSEQAEYFLICTPKAKIGYVKKTDLYLHFIANGSDSYLFGISSYGTDNDISCASSKLKVIKLSNNLTIENELNDSIMGRNYDIKNIHNSALKNSYSLFFLSYHCYSGLGFTANHFIVDNGKQLSRLILTVSSGDGGSSDLSTVYLPVRLTNGKKIVLARNGVLSIDETTAKPEIYPYPSNVDIPIDELIVVENKTAELLWDDKNEDMKYNSDGTIAERFTNIETIFYRWDGTTIHKMKTINGK